MRMSLSLSPLFLCLLYMTAQARPPSQSDFDFLEPFNDTALVANGLELTGSIAGFSLSTLLNIGIWWGVCKTAVIVSSTHDLDESETKELEKFKTDFCLHLAPLMTTTEVALAGHVSPWPLEQRWWKPLYFAGAGMAAYATTTKMIEQLYTAVLIYPPSGAESRTGSSAVSESILRKMAVSAIATKWYATAEYTTVAVLIYLASEALSTTAASAISVLILRKMSVKGIATEWNAVREYAILSVINGFMAGAVVYEALIHKGFRSEKAILAAFVSAAIAGTLSGIISLSTIDVDGQTKAVAGVGILAGILAFGASVGVGAADVAFARVLVGTMVVASASAPAGVAHGATAVALAGAISGGVAALLMLGSWKITPNNPFIKAGVTLGPVLTFAVINSLSNYAVYGYPLEEGFSETGWTQWKKFYVPLDYLSTLFR
ncbi:hypothetical protein [Endozoicomonas sp. 8E]|uniref:hypothetical protein n=1 Tax=Endozoicomonas sp. 8E TaxID=3035692 RepID=UPI0029394D82|nr:hypothetical protein [Endozoicomonas sp. 8E]WOG27382.1 hypothetical protein P6910_22990 [Endozoicomonas sp. 8E]